MTFSYMSVHQSVSLSMGVGPHVTITHDAFNLIVLGPAPSQTLNMGSPGPGPCPLLVTSCGHHQRPVQTCSLDLTVQGPTRSDIWWWP